MKLTPWLLPLLILLSQTAYGATLEVEAPWVREGPPSAQVLAGFMVLRNNSETAITITGVTAEDFQQVEIHRTVITDGIAGMVRQDRLHIGAGETCILEPGGYHLMLIGPRQRLLAGNSSLIVLAFESGGEQSIHAQVRKSGATMDHKHHH